MKHWNKDQLCSMQIKTTGPDPFKHEIYEIAILPVNHMLEPYMLPLDIMIKPEFPERIDFITRKRERAAIMQALDVGQDRYHAQDLFKMWVETMNLAEFRYGYHKIIPLGYQFHIAYMYLVRWLEIEIYNEFFNAWPVDLASVARYKNDRSGSHGEVMFFGKIFLKYMASVFNIKVEQNTALQEAIAMAKIYKELLSRGIFA